MNIFNIFRPPKSDKDLIFEIQQGNIDEFEEIYNRYEKKIYFYVLNILNNNKEDATQIVGDIFIKIFNKVKEKGNVIENLNSYIYRTAHNEAVQWIERNKSENFQDYTLENNIEVSDGTNVSGDINKKYISKIIQKVFKGIDKKYKEALFLYYYEEKSYDEIGEILGMGKNSVGTLISRGKEKLKNELKEKNIQKNDLFI